MDLNVPTKVGLILTLTLIRISPILMATTTPPVTTTTTMTTTSMAPTQNMTGTTTTAAANSTTTTLDTTTSNTTDMSAPMSTTTDENTTTAAPDDATTDKVYTFTETEFNILVGVSAGILLLLLTLAVICGCWWGKQTKRRHRRRREKLVTYYQPVDEEVSFRDDEFYKPEIKEPLGDIFIPIDGKPIAAPQPEVSPAHITYRAPPSVLPYSPYLYDDRAPYSRGAYDRPYRSNLEMRSKRTDRGWMLSAPSLHQDLPRVWI